MPTADSIICRATSGVASNVGLAIVAALTLFWVGDGVSQLDILMVVDGLLSGGSFFVGLMIYREAGPRDVALHKKADGIIRAIDEADDKLIGIEKSGDATS